MLYDLETLVVRVLFLLTHCLWGPFFIYRCINNWEVCLEDFFSKAENFSYILFEAYINYYKALIWYLFLGVIHFYYFPWNVMVLGTSQGILICVWQDIVDWYWCLYVDLVCHLYHHRCTLWSGILPKYQQKINLSCHFLNLRG